MGSWEVESIYENGNIVPKEILNDSIVIEFREDGRIMGNSTRNILTGQYEIFNNDSIWISYIGGTEVGATAWEDKFTEIIPVIIYYRFPELNILEFYTEDQEQKIKFLKK